MRTLLPLFLTACFSVDASRVIVTARPKDPRLDGDRPDVHRRLRQERGRQLGVHGRGAKEDADPRVGRRARDGHASAASRTRALRFLDRHRLPTQRILLPHAARFDLKDEGIRERERAFARRAGSVNGVPIPIRREVDPNHAHAVRGVEVDRDRADIDERTRRRLEGRIVEEGQDRRRVGGGTVRRCTRGGARSGWRRPRRPFHKPSVGMAHHRAR